MKKTITEFKESILGIAGKYSQEEEKVKTDFQSASKEIIAGIKSEKENLERKQKETETELGKIRTKIDIKKQQYNKSMQELNEEKTKKLECEIMELAEQERILTLRHDAYGKIDGCDNERTNKLFLQLYALYKTAEKEEREVRENYEDVLKELENLKEPLEKAIKEIGRLNAIYDTYSTYNSLVADYKKREVVAMFEIMHGKINLPKDSSPWDSVNDKLRFISKVMARKQNRKIQRKPNSIKA